MKFNFYKQEELSYQDNLDRFDQQQWEVEAIEDGPDHDSQVTTDQSAFLAHSL